MAHEIFISYSSKDREVAESICQALERDGVSCWIAPRNITPGRKWGGSIIDAINGSKVMVLVFSRNANESQQILREVERSVNKGVPVIPFRIDEIEPNKDLEYYIMTEHWLDAYTKPMDRHIERLSETVKSLIPYKEKDTDGDGTDEGELDKESREAAEEIDRIREERGDEVVVTPDPVSRTKKIAAAVAALVVFAALSAFFGLLVVFIPAVCTIAAWWLIGRFRDTNRSPMFPALTLVGGHILWYMIGMLTLMMLFGGSESLLRDAPGTLAGLVISAVLFIWLLLKPGKVSAAANMVGVAFLLIEDLSVISQAPDPLVFNGVILHSILFVATLAALGYGLLKLRKSDPGRVSGASAGGA